MKNFFKNLILELANWLRKIPLTKDKPLNLQQSLPFQNTNLPSTENLIKHEHKDYIPSIIDPAKSLKSVNRTLVPIYIGNPFADFSN